MEKVPFPKKRRPAIRLTNPPIPANFMAFQAAEGRLPLG